MAESRQATPVIGNPGTDQLPCGVVSFLDDGTVTYANATLLGLVGYDLDEVEGRPFESLLTIAGRIFLQTHLYPMIRLHGRASEMFVLMRRKDGSDVGVLLNAARRSGDGTEGIVCVMMEVVERRKFEDALLRAKQSAEAANQSLVARSRELEEANHILESQAVELEVQQETLEEQAAELEMRSGELDVANQFLAGRSEELERARDSAEEANRAKSQFLAVMSHELRTPLNAIGGYVQLIELGIHGPVTDPQREALERITRAQRHLLRLINDVLNLARIEAGKVDYVSEPLPVAELVESVLPMVEPQISTAGLVSSVDIGEGLVVRADREKVQQILINLLTNAVKFTPAGGKLVTRADSSPTERQVMISVSDSGIGIPPGKLVRIFEPFVQVDTGHTRRREGSGLGLAISRDLARGMGGDLSVRSEEGRGSTFTLTLPMA